MECDGGRGAILRVALAHRKRWLDGSTKNGLPQPLFIIIKSFNVQFSFFASPCFSANGVLRSILPDGGECNFALL